MPIEWNRYDLARQYVPRLRDTLPYDREHVNCFVSDGEPYYWTAGTKGGVIYQWSPEKKELTYWQLFLCSTCPTTPRYTWAEALREMLQKKQSGQTAQVVLADPISAKAWPTLWEHLTRTTYPDGQDTPRQTSTLTIFRRDDGSLGATLNDRDNQRALFSSGTTLKGLLDSLDFLAGDQNAVWREDRQQTGSSKRKK